MVDYDVNLELILQLEGQYLHLDPNLFEGFALQLPQNIQHLSFVEVIIRRDFHLHRQEVNCRQIIRLRVIIKVVFMLPILNPNLCQELEFIRSNQKFRLL